jgi:acyl carrier protein
MNREELKQTVFGVISTIAPETEPDAINPGRPLRDQTDLDSVDWLNFLVALNGTLGVEISDVEAARLRTLDDLLDFLQSRLAGERSGSKD